MNSFRYGAICLLIAFTVVSCAKDGLHLHDGPYVKKGWTVPLNDLGLNGDLRRLDEPHRWQVRQVSSFDRSGGNNDDRGGHQVWDGGVVLADLEGPGVVTRLWSRNPHGVLYIFVDDIEHPIITTSFEGLFGGNVEFDSPAFNLFAPPFTNSGSGGYYSYVPIPFEKHCRIMATGVDDSLGYQVTYLDLPAGTPIQSFDIELTKDDQLFFKEWEDKWNFTSYRWSDRDIEEVWESRHLYRPDNHYQVVPLRGSGVITEIEMEVESANEEIMDNVWLAIFFDGQDDPGVLSPIGDFFGASSKDVDDYDSMALGRVDGRMWCRFPMPYREAAEIRLINLSDQIADIAYWVTYRPEEVMHDNYFFARYNSAKTVEGKPYEVLSVEGEGHFVGASIAAANADSLIILEGDDSYSVDGRPKEDFHGTGTDDYFNAGWYFAEGNSSDVTHGVALKDASKPNGFSAFRSHFTEPVTFEKSFVFHLEHGPSNNRPGVDYSSISYWYQNSKTPNLKPIPEVQGIEMQYAD